MIFCPIKKNIEFTVDKNWPQKLTTYDFISNSKSLKCVPSQSAGSVGVEGGKDGRPHNKTRTTLGGNNNLRSHSAGKPANRVATKSNPGTPDLTVSSSRVVSRPLV